MKDKTKTGRKIQYGRISQIEREEQKKFVKDLLDRNLVEEGDGSFIAPLILVKKKDGTKRIVVDYRQLNDNTVRDNYPIPRIDDTIDRLHGMKVFSTLDATDGFWQILMEKLHKIMTKMPTDANIADGKVVEETDGGSYILTKDGRLWRKDKFGRRLCLPREWGQFIVHSCHANNHFGVN